MNLVFSTLAIEGTFQASLYNYQQALLQPNSLVSLLATLQPAFLFQTSGITPLGQDATDATTFVDAYSSYYADFIAGKEPNPALCQSLCCCLSRDVNSLYALKIDEARQLIKTRAPVVQMQVAKTRLFANEPAQYWGLKFTIARLYQSSKDGIIHKLAPTSPNAQLFSELQRWLRHHTSLVPNSLTPLRLDENCQYTKSAG